jgi:hypothetical protein
MALVTVRQTQLYERSHTGKAYAGLPAAPPSSAQTLAHSM